MAYCFIERHVNVPGTMWCECGSLVSGTPIDGYNVISYLGHGTSGDVYLAEQPALNNRKVVIKIAHRSWNQWDIDNFRREAALLASLSHPYILPIYAYGVIYERQSPVFTYSPYLVLPYAEQGSLEDAFTRAGKRPLPLLRVVSIAQEIAEALDYAHSRGVLHRDVKPANLLQMGSHVLLSDFSVASLIDADATHVNAPWAGSPAYMAPEVWRQSPGRYSDQYALAVTCFRLLAGDYPWAKMNEGKRSFQSADCEAVGAPAPLQAALQESPVQEWLHLHCHVPPMSLQAYRPNLPGAVDLVLQMGMAKDPGMRYETVQAFAADLLDASEEKTLALNKAGQQVDGRRQALPPHQAPHLPLQRALPLDVQTGGKEWKSAIGRGNVLTSNAPIPRLEAWKASSFTRTPSPPRFTLAPVGEVEPVTEGIQENVGADVSGPPPIDRPNPGSSIPSAGREVTQRNIDRRSARSAHRWLWSALLLNWLICVLLAAEAYWQSKDIMSALNLLLALCPSLLLGPLLARWFRRVRLTTLSWGVFWGVFFGMTNVLLSGLVCYFCAALAKTIPHWGHDWQQAGDGLRIFVAQVVGLAYPTLTPLLLGLWLAVLGGALLGISIYSGSNKRGISISSGVSPP